MKKPVKILLLVLSVILLALLFQVIHTYSKIDNALIEYRIYSQSKKIQDIIKNYEVIECNFSLFKPEYSIVAYKHYSEDRKTYDVAFYSPVRSHIFSSDWTIEYTGGTTVNNTNFDELVAMVKEDCEQFKKSKGDFRDETINWIYSPYEPEPEKTEEQIEAEKQESIADAAWEARYILEEMLSEETVQKAIEEHGDWEGLNDEELIEWYKEASK